MDISGLCLAGSDASARQHDSRDNGTSEGPAGSGRGGVAGAGELFNVKLLV